MLVVLGRCLALAVALLPMQAVAGPAVLVDVDLARQQMTVDVDGKRAHAWPVSTARSEYVTPTGRFVPQRMHKIWYSRKYDDAPMPNAIFYSGGFAIHGTSSVGMLGRPASHGCVRLAPGHAATLFGLVQHRGLGATRIVIHGAPPRSQAVVARRAPAASTYTPVATSASDQGLLTGLLGWSQPAAAVAPQQAYRSPKVYLTPRSPSLLSSRIRPMPR